MPSSEDQPAGVACGPGRSSDCPSYRLLSETSHDRATADATATVRRVSLVAGLKLTQYPFILASAMLLPRMMGPETYGQYALLLSFIAIASSALDLGVCEIFARFIPEIKPDADNERLTTLSSRFLALKALTSMVGSAALFAVLQSLYIRRLPTGSFVLVAAILPTIDLGLVPYAIAFGLNQLERCALRDVFKRSLTLVLTVVLFHYFGLLGALATTLIVEVLLAALFFFWTRQYFSSDSFRLKPSYLKPYLGFGFFFYLSFMVSSVWQKLGNSLIEWLTASPGEVALFDIANQMFFLAASFFTVTITAFVPVFTRLLLSGREHKILEWSRLILKYAVILGIVMYSGFVALGPDLIPLVIGDAYRDLFPSASVMLLAIFPMALAQLGVVFAILYKQPARYLRALALAFAAFIIASLKLIPTYAALGCSWATFISHLVLLASMCWYFRTSLLPSLGGAAKSVALGVVFVPILLLGDGAFTRLTLLVAVLAAYGSVLFLLDVLQWREVRMLYHAMTGRHTSEELPARRPA